jgi:hypothetical protein
MKFAIDLPPFSGRDETESSDRGGRLRICPAKNKADSVNGSSYAGDANYAAGFAASAG